MLKEGDGLEMGRGSLRWKKLVELSGEWRWNPVKLKAVGSLRRAQGVIGSGSLKSWSGVSYGESCGASY